MGIACGEKTQFSCRVSTEADGLRMTVNEYGAKEGAVVLSVKDGGFSFLTMGVDQVQVIYLRFDENPWIRRLPQAMWPRLLGVDFGRQEFLHPHHQTVGP